LFLIRWIFESCYLRPRQEHKAGEKMFVDWAGATIPVYDRNTGIAWQAPLFVAALGANS
jgi:transposase